MPGGGDPDFRGVTVKMKFADFSQTTVEEGASSLQVARLEHLLATAWERGRKPVRLLGVGVRLGMPPEPVRQLSLFDAP